MHKVRPGGISSLKDTHKILVDPEEVDRRRAKMMVANQTSFNPPGPVY